MNLKISNVILLMWHETPFELAFRILLDDFYYIEEKYDYIKDPVIYQGQYKEQCAVKRGFRFSPFFCRINLSIYFESGCLDAGE